VRKFIYVLLLTPILFVVRHANAATLASSGQLNVPSDARVMVISTDFAMQQVLSEDFAVARRRKSAAGPPKVLTLTVTLMQRVLQPNVSMIDLAPGVPHAAELIKAAGYQPPIPTKAQPMSRDVAAYMAQGNPSAAGYNGGYMGQPMTNQLQQQFNPYMSGPPTAPDPRDPLNRPIPPPDYLQPNPARIYDTAVIAHAVLSDGKGEMTAVALAKPGENLDEVRKELAERIANAVLH
jgi:hypothetical protein